MKNTLKIIPLIKEQDVFLQKKDWQSYFCNKNALELEIGIGRAHYIFERALKNPKINIIGVEYKKRWIEQANRKIARENISNVCVIHGNAWILIPNIFKNESLITITLNFPDPWWKRRHHKRRIINKKFINLLVSKLSLNGSFLLQSDVKEIFNKYLAELESNINLFNIKKNRESKFFPNPMNAQSHREKKCIKLGISIYRALLIKK